MEYHCANGATLSMTATMVAILNRKSAAPAQPAYLAAPSEHMCEVLPTTEPKRMNTRTALRVAHSSSKTSRLTLSGRHANVCSGSHSDLSRCFQNDRFTPGSGHAGLVR